MKTDCEREREKMNRENRLQDLPFIELPNVPRPFINAVWKVGDECTNMLIKKQNDYGPKNISNAPGGPLNGLRVRIFDKVSRINNLLDTGVTPENESLRDSFVDLANYALIALMVLDGNWDSSAEGKKTCGK